MSVVAPVNLQALKSDDTFHSYTGPSADNISLEHCNELVANLFADLSTQTAEGQPVLISLNPNQPGLFGLGENHGGLIPLGTDAAALDSFKKSYVQLSQDKGIRYPSAFQSTGSNHEARHDYSFGTGYGSQRSSATSSGYDTGYDDTPNIPPPARNPFGTNNGTEIMGGIDIMFAIIALQNFLAQDLFQKLKDASDRSHNSQYYANTIDSIIAKMLKDGATHVVPADIVKYMEDHGITVIDPTTNKTVDIDTFTDHGAKALDKGDLEAVKSSLETDSGRYSDFVSQNNSQIQKYTQTYQVCLSSVSSLYNLIKDVNLGISQKIG